ncbi:MAG: MMPL family transporter [Actinomycetes bacterium]
MASWVVGRRTKYLVLVFWFVVIAAAGPLAGQLTDVQENEAKSWLPGNAESTQALDLQNAFVSENTIPAVVVYERSGGLADADRAAIADDAETWAALPSLDGKVTGPVPSEDGEAAQVIVPLNLGSDGWEKAGDVVDDMLRDARGGPAGLSVHVTGPAGAAADSAEAFDGIDTSLLLAAVTVVVVILLLTYRSPFLWLLPVVSAGVALTTAQAVIYLLAKHADLTVNAQSAGILTVLVFGAGTDYALLLVARYREELRRHTDRHEAMAIALHRAGPAIIASAGTVVLGLLCLAFAETNSTKGLGPVTAIGVAVGLLAMISLLPAMLVTAGRWVFWPKRPAFGSEEPTASGWWARLGQSMSRRPRRVWVATAVVLGAMGLGMVSLNADGLTNAEQYRGTPDSVVGERVVQGHFAGGAGSPVVVVGDAPAADELRSALAGTAGIAEVTEPVARDGVAYVEGTLAAAPDSQAAYDTIDRARTAVHAVDGADAKVGGNTAINLDVQRAAQHDRELIIPIVLVVVLLILGLLLRAVVAPLILVATVVLSFAAAMGVSALVFDHVFGFGGADSSLPLFVFVFLVALGIDYNIFLMSRVREEAAHHGTRRGAIIGLGATGGVITSAGLVLAGTFAVLATLPLTAFAEIGFAVAFGVLLDTIVVRSVLVTALNLDIGRHMWWPSRLAARGDEQERQLGEDTVGAARGAV